MTVRVKFLPDKEAFLFELIDGEGNVIASLVKSIYESVVEETA